MNRPWMKFYPGDWRADPALRMCSIGARGLWMEILCLMHEATPRGSLLVNGLAITERQLASLSGISPKEAERFIEELRAAGVFSEDNGVIFSRRIRRDEEKADRDKANGKTGGNPDLMPGVNPPLKAYMLEARSQKVEERKKEKSAATSAATPSDDLAANSKTRNKGKPLPDDWRPSPDLFAHGASLGMVPHEIEAEAENMRNWARSEGHRAVTRKLDWDGTFHNWLTREAKKLRGNSNGKRSSSDKSLHAAGERILAKIGQWGGDVPNTGAQPTARELRGSAGDADVRLLPKG